MKKKTKGKSFYKSNKDYCILFALLLISLIIIIGFDVIGGENIFGEAIRTYSSQQSAITPRIQNISDKEIGGTSQLDKLINILYWLHGYYEKGPTIAYSEYWIMRRTTDQIIFDGINRDKTVKEKDECSDYALMFVTLARSKGLQARYVQTVSQDWLDKTPVWNGTVRGHAFAEVYINGRWYVVNPQGQAHNPSSIALLTRKFTETTPTVYPYRKTFTFECGIGFIKRNCTVEYILETSATGYERYTIFGVGKDAWDIGLHSLSEFKQKVKEKYF